MSSYQDPKIIEMKRTDSVERARIISMAKNFYYTHSIDFVRELIWKPTSKETATRSKQETALSGVEVLMRL